MPRNGERGRNTPFKRLTSSHRLSDGGSKIRKAGEQTSSPENKSSFPFVSDRFMYVSTETVEKGDFGDRVPPFTAYF